MASTEVSSALLVLVLGIVTHGGVSKVDGFDVPFWGGYEDGLLLLRWCDSCDLAWLVKRNLASFPCGHATTLQISLILSISLLTLCRVVCRMTPQ